MIKSIRIYFIVTLTTFVWISWIFFNYSYINTDFWCLYEYLKSWLNEWYIYKVGKYYHVDTQLINDNEFKLIWTVKNCLYNSNELTTDIINWIYCNVWYFYINNFKI